MRESEKKNKKIIKERKLFFSFFYERTTKRTKVCKIRLMPKSSNNYPNFQYKEPFHRKKHQDMKLCYHDLGELLFFSAVRVSQTLQAKSSYPANKNLPDFEKSTEVIPQRILSCV